MESQASTASYASHGGRSTSSGRFSARSRWTKGSPAFRKPRSAMTNRTIAQISPIRSYFRSSLDQQTVTALGPLDGHRKRPADSGPYPVRKFPTPKAVTNQTVRTTADSLIPVDTIMYTVLKLKGPSGDCCLRQNCSGEECRRDHCTPDDDYWTNRKFSDDDCADDERSDGESTNEDRPSQATRRIIPSSTSAAESHSATHATDEGDDDAKRGAEILSEMSQQRPSRPFPDAQSSDGRDHMPTHSDKAWELMGQSLDAKFTALLDAERLRTWTT